jgi:phage tail sheath protein FI
MALFSPGIEVKEHDFSTTISSGPSSLAGTVGYFKQGPANTRITVTSEDEFVEYFGKPDNDTFQSFFTVSNFLKYSSSVTVVRAIAPNAFNAYALLGGTGSGNPSLITNVDTYETGTALNVSGVRAKSPGTIGNDIKVLIIDGSNIPNEDEMNLDTAAAKLLRDAWNSLPIKPTEDERVVFVTSNDSTERYIGNISASHKDFAGNNDYIDNIVNKKSGLIYINTSDIEYAESSSLSVALGDGSDGTLTEGSWKNAWDQYLEEGVQVNLLIGGASADLAGVAEHEAIQKYIVENVAEVRKDCFALISPHKTTVVGKGAPQATTDMVQFRNDLNLNSSYASLDGNFKYQYDKYNDVNRWVNLSGDVAGCCVTTDNEKDPWWSPAGLERGQIKGVIKLAYNPKESQRDLLYLDQINPIVSFPGDGVVLWGDKTLQSTASAFDRINVRRLFLVVESAVELFAKPLPFNFNDTYTRTDFTASVTSFLEGIKVKRGIIDYMVQCDESNNTDQVIDNNQFVASVFIRPSKSINFITLNFVATKGGVSFSELFGAI